MRHCIIFNPTARGERAKRFLRHLNALSDQCSLKPTRGAGGARGLAAEAVLEGFDTVVAAGGDGTVNEVLNGIGDVPGGFDRVRLGVLPLGTVNVFALDMRIPSDMARAWEVICCGREIAMDLPEAEYLSAEGKPERRYFVQLAGAGLDAKAVQMVSWELKKKIGYLAYVAAGMQALQGERPLITVSNGKVVMTGELVLLGNGRFYGGRLPLFSDANFHDGLLDVCVFGRVNWFTIGRYVCSLMAQRVLGRDMERHFQGSEVEMSGTSETFLELDGELVGRLPARFRLKQNALRVVVP